MSQTASNVIHIWHNKQTDAPSVEIGPLTVDLGQETAAQQALFALVMNNPDTVIQGHVIAPVTPEIAEAIVIVIAEEIQKQIPKRVAQKVDFQIDKS